MNLLSCHIFVLKINVSQNRILHDGTKDNGNVECLALIVSVVRRLQIGRSQQFLL